MAYTRTDRALNELSTDGSKGWRNKKRKRLGNVQDRKDNSICSCLRLREMHPKFMQNVERGTLRCNYNMMAFSGSGNRVKAGPSRRSREIGLVTQNALAPVIDLTEYPKTVVDVFIELLQTDAGTRCAGICAASLALADAGFKMKDLVCAVSCGVVGDTPVVDLDYSEESYEGGAVDIPIAVIPRTGEITLLQLDGVLSKEQLQKAVTLAKHGIDKIYEVQKAALRAKFTGGK